MIKEHLKSHGHSHSTWVAINKVFEDIGKEGMSADDSAVKNGRTVYHIRHIVWWADWIGDWLDIVDSNCNFSMEYRETRPGNPPRIWKCGLDVLGRETQQSAVPGLPVNYYDVTWYSSLLPNDKVDLCTREEVPQPRFYCG